MSDGNWIIFGKRLFDAWERRLKLPATVKRPARANQAKQAGQPLDGTALRGVYAQTICTTTMKHDTDRIYPSVELTNGIRIGVCEQRKLADYVHGAGQAFDPNPRETYCTHIDNDSVALTMDLRFVSSDYARVKHIIKAISSAGRNQSQKVFNQSKTTDGKTGIISEKT